MTPPPAPPTPVASAVPSPCVDVCRMDTGGQLCLGCLRTLPEIAAWSRMDDAARRQVLAALPHRAELGRMLRVVEGLPADIGD